ncbi:hypothetical protein MRB53_004182 [Persea americana]|uniref:Uncharacterized protein n=1 Tax=Persea americana TaxID=3435 RepID=A0ACC2MZT8_PERAE|nr:hypothetical protein MRB53_004182 [Persea americana]
MNSTITVVTVHLTRLSFEVSLKLETSSSSHAAASSCAAGKDLHLNDSNLESHPFSDYWDNLQVTEQLWDLAYQINVPDHHIASITSISNSLPLLRNSVQM